MRVLVRFITKTGKKILFGLFIVFILASSLFIGLLLPEHLGVQTQQNRLIARIIGVAIVAGAVLFSLALYELRDGAIYNR